MNHILAGNIILLAIAALDCTIAIWVWTRRPSHPAHWTFLIFVAGAGIWTIGKVFLTLTHSFIFGQLTLFGGIITVGGFTLLCDVFPSKQRVEKTFWISLIPLALLAALVPAKIFIRGTIILESGATKPLNGQAFPLLAAILSCYVLYTLYILFRRYSRMRGVARLQMQYVIAGISGMLIVSLISDVLLPAFNIFSLNFLGPASSILIVGATAYAIVKHQLLEIKAVILRGTIFSLLTTVIIALYIGITALLIHLGLHSNSKTASLISAGLTTLAGVYGAPVLEKKFRKATDKIFFKERYDYAQALHNLSDSLNTNLDLETLMHETAYTMRKIFKVERITIATFEPWRVFTNGSSAETSKNISIPLLQEAVSEQPQILLKDELELKSKDPEQAANARQKSTFLMAMWQKHGYELMIKFLASEKLVGAMVMTGKLSGDKYTKQDIQLLKTFSNQAAVAIEKSLLYNQIKSYALNLEEKVHLRTQELQKLQLGQKHMMEDISHGLQTPLTILKNELSELSKNSAAPKTNLSVIEKSIDYISSLIYNLLRLSRLETLSGLHEKKNFNLSELLTEITEYAEVVCEQKGIALERKIEPQIFINGNYSEIKELVQNLLGNAVRYTIEGPDKAIGVSLIRAGDTISLKVKDMGIGIEKDELERIFDRFYRGQRSKDTNIKGTGLGLAICRQIAKNHGGNITAESEPGQGSVFIVELRPGILD